MKKVNPLTQIIKFILIGIFLYTAQTSVFAQNPTSSTSPGYARILDENTVFYTDPGCTIEKFVLPYGYFVKVMAVGEDSVAVRYMDESPDMPARDGFILTKCYYPCEYTASDSPYPTCKLKLMADEVLFSDSQATIPKTVLTSDKICRFYGYRTINGEKFYCVYANGYIGYVRAKAFEDSVIPPHSLPIKNESDSEDKTLSAGESDDFSAKQTTPHAIVTDSAIKTIVIIAVSLVALSVVYLLFRPNHKHRYAFTDNDSDDLL